jgi:hypothetical protein
MNFWGIEMKQSLAVLVLVVIGVGIVGCSNHEKETDTASSLAHRVEILECQADGKHKYYDGVPGTSFDHDYYARTYGSNCLLKGGGPVVGLFLK